MRDSGFNVICEVPSSVKRRNNCHFRTVRWCHCPIHVSCIGLQAYVMHFTHQQGQLPAI